MRFCSLMLTLALAGCAPCENRILSRVPSPDGKLEAVVFDRECGATTGFNTQVSIVLTGTDPTEAGNAFIADDDHGRAHTDRRGALPLQLTWEAPDRLSLTYPEKARLFRSESSVGGVSVVYRTGEPQPSPKEAR